MQHVVFLGTEILFQHDRTAKYVNSGNLFGNVLIHTQNRMEMEKRVTQTKDCVYLKQIKFKQSKVPRCLFQKQEKKCSTQFKKLLYWFCPAHLDIFVAKSIKLYRQMIAQRQFKMRKQKCYPRDSSPCPSVQLNEENKKQ